MKKDNSIIQDYGKTVKPEVYISTLQGHQYIPQADQCIRNILLKYFLGPHSFPDIIDLACGPGRLTFDFVRDNEQSRLYGIDIAKDFINFARTKARQSSDPSLRGITFIEADFLDIENVFRGGFEHGVECIVMQGVAHHIHGDDRKLWFEKCLQLLKPNGILVIGDEFIKDYGPGIDRKINVCKFYLHIIDEARKGGFNDLAEEEAKNLIDDVFSGESIAGVGNGESFELIYHYAEIINEMFYETSAGEFRQEGYNQCSNLIRGLNDIAVKVNNEVDPNFNRGDYKTSIIKFTEEVVQYGFLKTEIYKIGPVDQLGGMGVLVFSKQQ